eukprot:754934-Alexandrium_andersonii.AAC.1
MPGVLGVRCAAAAAAAGWLRCGPPLRAAECRRLSRIVADQRGYARVRALLLLAVLLATLARLGASML